jgi:hypothetical protein
MNVPFPPLWLLPFPILWIAACVLSLRRSRAARHGLQSLLASEDTLENQRRAAAVMEALRVRGRALNGLILAVLALYELVFFTAPPVRGRVIELQTGRPIAGTKVTRHLSQVGAWKITEGPTSAPAFFSTLSVRSDSKGEFTLPGYINLLPGGIQGLSGMSWVIWESGWMPAYNCVVQGFHPWGASWIGCGAFGGAMIYDPWVQTKVDRLLGFTTLEVRVSRPTLEGVTFGGIDSHGRFVPAPGLLKGHNDDPWGEYFRRLNILTQFRYLKKDEFVQEAVTFVEKHPLTEVALSEIASLIPSGPCDTPYCHDPRIRRLARALVEYCDHTPESEYCAPRRAQMIQRLREWLESSTGND